MGVKGSDIRIAKNDGIVRRGRRSSRSPSRRSAPACSTPAPTTAICRCRATAARPWTDVYRQDSRALPKGICVSEVVPSRFDEGTVYVTFDGHRQNDFETYIYVEQRLRPDVARRSNGNLKGEVVKTLTEDLKNPDVLYIGTETGLFVSIDRGKSWTRVEGEPADGAHRRDHAASARQRDDPRDARPRDLDPRSPRADPGVRGGAGRRGRREAVHAAAVRDVPASGARSQLRVLGRPDVLRREPAAGGGDLVVHEEAGRAT